MEGKNTRHHRAVRAEGAKQQPLPGADEALEPTGRGGSGCRGHGDKELQEMLCSTGWDPSPGPWALLRDH